MRKTTEKTLIVLLRLGMGWIFLWAFLDRAFGLGFGTEEGTSWISGHSPTEGFLANETAGSPLADIFQAMAGHGWVDWIFMLGLLGIGVAFIFGIMTRLAGVVGALMSLLVYIAVFPVESDPFMSYHLVYALVFFLLIATPSGHWLGLGRRWDRTRLVTAFPFLR